MIKKLLVLLLILIEMFYSLSFVIGYGPGPGGNGGNGGNGGGWGGGGGEPPYEYRCWTEVDGCGSYYL